MPDIDDLTYFTVVRTVAPVPAGVLSADVVFEAQVTRGLAVQADVSPDVIEILVRPVHARIVDGALMKDGTPGVSLLSAAEVAIDGGFSYLASFKNVRLDGTPLPVRDALKDLIFEALDTAGTFDLKDAAPVVASTATPTARGPRGFGIDSVTRIGNTLRSWVQGLQVGNVDISDLIFNGTFDSLTDATATGKSLGRAASRAAARAAIDTANVVAVSNYVPTTATYQAAIAAAITAAAAKPSGVVDFEGITYTTTASVMVTSPGVKLINGGVTAGQFPPFQVSGANVTFERLKVTRSTSAGVLDLLALQSCVSVSAEGFRSIDCDYVGAAQACVYLANGVSNGAEIRGGSMTGTAARQNACGVYAAAGAAGNRNVTVEGVYIHDTTDSILLFDTGYSTVRGNRIEHLRRLPTINLTGWTNVSGNVWRQRTASGTNPGVDGAATDRVDGTTTVVFAAGVNLPIVAGTTPGTNQASTTGGYVYINLGGTDPNTVTVTSGLVSGYGPTVYVTGTAGVNEHLACKNIISENHVFDVDGFGIYLQLGYYAGAVGNQLIGNSLTNVCLEGTQTQSLPFAGIGINGGNDTILNVGVIEGAGTVSKPAPSVYIIPSPTGLNTDPSGEINGLTVRNGTADGFLISASNWHLNGCRSRNNAGNGYRVWTATTGAIVENVELNGCRGPNNGANGAILDGSIASIGYISARIVGGSYNNNGNRGGGHYSDTTAQTVRDSSIIGAQMIGNGSVTFHAQIHLRGACLKSIVDDCTLKSATFNAVGLSVDSQVVAAAVGINQYSLTTPELLNAPVRIAGSRGGEQWRGSGSPEGVVTALVGATYHRSDGGSGTTLYIKESGTGNTGWTAVASSGGTGDATATASTLALRDSNANLKADAFIATPESTVTAAGTKTLTIDSPQVQKLTGASTHTVLLPTTGVVTGQQYVVANQSTGGVVTVQSSGANTIESLSASSTGVFTAAVDTPTTAAHWTAVVVQNGKSLKVSNSLRLIGTDSTAMTFPTASDTVVGVAATQTLAAKTLTAPKISGGSGTATISAGTGTPEGAVTATVGSVFMRTDGGAATTLYTKESGSGNTGWVAK